MGSPKKILRTVANVGSLGVAGKVFKKGVTKPATAVAPADQTSVAPDPESMAARVAAQRELERRMSAGGGRAATMLTNPGVSTLG